MRVLYACQCEHMKTDIHDENDSYYTSFVSVMCVSLLVSKPSRLTSYFIVFMFGLFSIYFVIFLQARTHAHTHPVPIKIAEYSLYALYEGAR